MLTGRIDGIDQVKNRLILQKTVAIANEVLEERLERAIRRDAYLADDLDDGGEAMLVGLVDSEFEWQRLETVTGQVFGIDSITNAVRVDAFAD